MHDDVVSVETPIKDGPKAGSVESALLVCGVVRVVYRPPDRVVLSWKTTPAADLIADSLVAVISHADVSAASIRVRVDCCGSGHSKRARCGHDHDEHGEGVGVGAAGASAGAGGAGSGAGAGAGGVDSVDSVAAGATVGATVGTAVTTTTTTAAALSAGDDVTTTELGLTADVLSSLEGRLSRPAAALLQEMLETYSSV